jgi:glycolate oxidase FAD binding subunit
MTPSVTPDAITIDAVGPMPVVRPTTAAEVGEIVRRCAAEGTAVYPVGGGTMLDYGLPPARPGVAVELRSLDKVIDFPASDMTITVEAGITIARLNEITRAEGLHLPIDVPDPERATLGGAIACNVSGPRRYGYGTFRDYILGITTVNDRGESVSAGGRVVKNVAGYDLMKLHAGALGTLGVITRVTLKLRPVPEEIGGVFIGVPADRLAEALDIVHRSQTRPQYILCDPGIRTSNGLNWPTRVGFEGRRESITWQVDHLTEELGKDWAFYTGDVGNVGWTELPEISSRFLKDAACRLHASLPPSRVAEFCGLAASLDSGLCVFAFPGNGSAFIEFPSEAWPVARLSESLQGLLDVASSSGGRIVVQYCPSDWKKFLPVWGRPPADLALQKAVKRALDPQNILNPGRFVTDAF